MTHNPYEYDPEIDKDLFEDEEGSTPENEFQNSRSSPDDPYSSILDEIISQENLSPQEAEQLRGFLKKMTPNEPTTTLTSFLTFDAQNQSFRQQAPMYRAMMHVLNELTDGRVIKMWRIFDIEQQAIRTKATLEASKTVYENSLKKEASPAKMRTLDFVMEFINARLERLHNEYNMALESVEGYEADYSVFETGEKAPTTESWVNKIIFWREKNA